MDHGFTHTGARPYQCDACPATFSSFKAINRHRVTHLRLKPHRCILCSGSFATKYVFNLHMRKVHYRCAICDFSSAHLGDNAIEAFETHTRTHFQCPECEFNCLIGKHLRAHMATVHCKGKKVPYKCPVCKLRLDNEADSFEHFCEGQQPFACSVCGYSTRYEYELLAHHVKGHAGFNAFMCGECELSFKTAGDLETHARERHQRSPTEDELLL